MFEGRPTKRTVTVAVAGALLAVVLQATPVARPGDAPGVVASVLKSASDRVVQLYDSTRALVGLVRLARRPMVRPVPPPAPEEQLDAGELLRCEGTPASSEAGTDPVVNRS